MSPRGRARLACRYRIARERMEALAEEVSDAFWPWVKASVSRDEAYTRIIATPDHVTRCFMMDWFRREWPESV